MSSTFYSQSKIDLSDVTLQNKYKLLYMYNSMFWNLAKFCMDFTYVISCNECEFFVIDTSIDFITLVDAKYVLTIK